MSGASDGVLHRLQVRFQRLHRAEAFVQNWIEVHARQHEQLRRMPASLGATLVGDAQRLAKGVSTRMANNDRDGRHPLTPIAVVVSPTESMSGGP